MANEEEVPVTGREVAKVILYVLAALLIFGIFGLYILYNIIMYCYNHPWRGGILFTFLAYRYGKSLIRFIRL